MNRWAFILFLYFLSGAAALVDEVLFSRLLRFTFGASIQAVAAVTAAFLCGLGLGAWIPGGAARRSRRPVRAYGLMEVGIALMVPFFPFLSKALTPAAAALFQGLDPAGPAFGLARFGAAFLLLLPPAFLMGATFPLLVRAGVREEGPGAARGVGLLYGINTLGAALGALAAGFCLLPRLGYGGTVRVAAGLSLAAGLAALAAGNGEPLPDPPRGPDRGREPPPHGALSPWTAAAVTALGGFLSLDLQVTWTRLLTQVFGGTVYAFSLVLALFLAGLALGSALLPGSAARRYPGRKGLALLAAAGAGAAGAGILFFRAYFAPGVRLAGVDNLLPEPGSSFLGTFLGHAALTAAVVLPPTFFLGAILPLAAGPGAHAGERPRFAGLLYGASCAGCIAGALAAGFFLVPRLSSEGAILSGGGVLLAAAGLLLLGGPRAAPPGRGGLPAVLCTAALCVLAAAALWRPEKKEGPGVLFLEEGPAATAKVEAFREGKEEVRVLRINGKVVATTGFLDRRLQLLLGYCTALCHPSPRRVLSVGLGTGMSSGALARGAGSGAEVEVVELSSAVVHAAARFADLNHRILERARITRQDGRNRLLLARERFDVIAADPIHPWVAGSGNLYTLEYFSLAASRLSEGGVMAQWVPLYQLSARDVRTVLATFHAVFPSVRVFLTGYDLVVVGSRSPLSIDPRAWKRRIRSPGTARDLASIGIHGPEDLFACFLFSEAGLEAFLGPGAPVNRDADQTLEYSAPRSLWRPYDEGLLHDLLQAAEPLDGLAEITEWPEALFTAASERRLAYLGAVKHLFQDLLRGRAGARKRFREALRKG